MKAMVMMMENGKGVSHNSVTLVRFTDYAGDCGDGADDAAKNICITSL